MEESKIKINQTDKIQDVVFMTLMTQLTCSVLASPGYQSCLQWLEPGLESVTQKSNMTQTICLSQTNLSLQISEAGTSLHLLLLWFILQRSFELPSLKSATEEELDCQGSSDLKYSQKYSQKAIAKNELHFDRYA